MEIKIEDLNLDNVKLNIIYKSFKESSKFFKFSSKTSRNSENYPISSAVKLIKDIGSNFNFSKFDDFNEVSFIINKNMK